MVVKKKHSEIDFLSLYDDNPTALTPSQEDLACELQLQALGDWFPLRFKLDQDVWLNNLEQMSEWWIPFQPKEGITNDRECVLIYGMEGDSPNSIAGLSEHYERLGRYPFESEFNVPTQARTKLSVMHPVFDYFDPLGRTFLIRLNAGGFYPTHRDQYYLNRDTFRLIAFLGDPNEMLEWEVDGRKRQIFPNTVYYVDTRKEHRLCAWQHSETAMVVMNVKKDWRTIMKLLTKVRS